MGHLAREEAACLDSGVSGLLGTSAQPGAWGGQRVDSTLCGCSSWRLGLTGCYRRRLHNEPGA